LQCEPSSLTIFDILHSHGDDDRSNEKEIFYTFTQRWIWAEDVEKDGKNERKHVRTIFSTQLSSCRRRRRRRRRRPRRRNLPKASFSSSFPFSFSSATPSGRSCCPWWTGHGICDVLVVQSRVMVLVDGVVRKTAWWIIRWWLVVGVIFSGVGSGGTQWLSWYARVVSRPKRRCRSIHRWRRDIHRPGRIEPSLRAVVVRGNGSWVGHERHVWVRGMMGTAIMLMG
jgi:hypothetical protein